MDFKFVLVLMAFLALGLCVHVPTFRQYPVGGWDPYRPMGPYPNYPQRPGCPICDSSVFSYCSHKLVHDSCCCGDGYYTGNSFECEYTDCSYLHANSCKESELILTCCCDAPYKSYYSSYRPLFASYVKK